MAIWIEAKLLSADDEGATYVYRTRSDADYTGEVWFNRELNDLRQIRPAEGERGTFATERVFWALRRDRRTQAGVFPEITTWCA